MLQAEFKLTRFSHKVALVCFFVLRRGRTARNMANTALVVILEKIASKDKDFRYMATSDLLHELQKDTFKADADLERKLCVVVLNQLEDPSGDISNLAVSWCVASTLRDLNFGSSSL